MTAPSINRAYLSLGSNIAPEQHLPAAIRLLGDYGRVLAVSTVWESAALGDPNQPNYLNAAVLLATPMTASTLRRQAIATIENTLGRRRVADNKNAARTIDIDMMLFNRAILQIGHRHIPDDEVLTRAFVAVPLAEIAPDYVHPVTGQTLRDIAAQFDLTALHPRHDVILHTALEDSSQTDKNALT